MRCTNCGTECRIAPEQVGFDNGGLPIYHRFAYCDRCMMKWDIDICVPEQTMFCKFCGARIPINSAFCARCGRQNISVQEFLLPSRVFCVNGITFDMEEIKSKLLIKTVANTANKVRKICKCEQGEAEEIVYGYFLSKHGEYTGNTVDLREKIRHIKSFDGKKLYCPYCLSRNIDIREHISGSISRGRSEIRKKSAVTRAGNRAGRAGMIMMTGGLWALTPKKSKYNEISSGKTDYQKTIIRTCMDCGKQI